MSKIGVSIGSGRWVRLGLLALAVVPVAAGASRLVELAGGPPVLPVVGDGELSSGLALGAGWVINLAVVEYVIGRHTVELSRPAATMVGP
jgi:hypothetical protein